MSEESLEKDYYSFIKNKVKADNLAYITKMLNLIVKFIEERTIFFDREIKGYRFGLTQKAYNDLDANDDVDQADVRNMMSLLSRFFNLAESIEDEDFYDYLGEKDVEFAKKIFEHILSHNKYETIFFHITRDSNYLIQPISITETAIKDFKTRKYIDFFELKMTYKSELNKTSVIKLNLDKHEIKDIISKLAQFIEKD